MMEIHLRSVGKLGPDEFLLSHQNVHHVNGDRSDNRIENLEIWDKAQPSGQRDSDKAKHYAQWLADSGRLNLTKRQPRDRREGNEVDGQIVLF